MSNFSMKMATSVAILGGIVASAVSAQAALNLPTQTCSYSFNTNMKQGSRGVDVMNLQKVLNMYAQTQVAEDGAGSPGMETTTFGPATKRAVNKFQALHLEELGITAPTGNVFSGTRALLNEVCSGEVVTTTPPTTTTYPAGCTSASGFSPITGASCSTGAVTTTPTTGPVSATLAMSQPTGNLISGQAGAALATIVLSGNGTVSSVTLNRGGVSDQSTLSNVYLYDGATRLTDGYSFNNAGTLTMNNVNLAVNGSRTITVRGDVASAALSGQTLSVILANFVAGTSATTVNLSGNALVVVNGTNLLSTANLTTSAPSPAAASVNAGAVNQNLWSNTVSVGLHAATLRGMTVKMIGSAPSNTLNNVGLFVDGTKVSSATINSNMQFVFDLTAAPFNLTTGSHNVEVRGDIVGGANRNFYISLEKASDLMINDSQVSGGTVSITPTYLTGTLNNLNAGLVTISNGSLTINQDVAFNNTTNLVGGATNVKMASFKVLAYGEDVKVNTLTFTPSITGGVVNQTLTTTATTPTLTAGAQTWTVASTAGMYVGQTLTTTGATTQAIATVTTVTNATTVDVTVTTGGTGVATGVTSATQSANAFINVGLYVNGGQVGSNQTATNGSVMTFSNLGSNLIATVGTPTIVEIRGDVMNSSNSSYSAGAVSFNLNAAIGSVQGVSSGQLNLSAYSAGGQSLTVSSSNVSFAQTSGWAGSSIAPNQVAKKIGSFTLQTGSAEGVTISNVLVALGGTMIGSNQISNITVKDGSTVVGTPVGNPTASNNFSVTIPVAMSTTKTFDVYADIGSGATGLDVIPKMTITYRGATSNVTTTSAEKTGSTLLAAVATIAGGDVTFVPSSSAVAQFLIGGQSSFAIGTFNIKANNAVGGAIVKDVTVTVPANTVGSVTMNGVTAQVVDTTAVLYNVGVVVPADAAGINVPMTVSLVCVGASNGCAGVSNTTATAQITTLTYNNGSSIVSISPTAITATSKLVASKPTIAMTTTSGSGLLNGNIKVGEFTVSADAAGDIKIQGIPVSINSTAGALMTAGTVELRDSTGNTVIVGTGGVNGAVALGAGTNSTVGTFAFSSPRTITKGTSETFTVYSSFTGVAGAANSMSVTFGLGDKNSLTWTDVIGGVAGITGAQLNTYPAGTQTKNN